MLPTLTQLDHRLHAVLGTLESTGRDTAGLHAQLDALPPGYDARVAFAQRLHDLPFRADWKHVEPTEWNDIAAELPDDPAGTPDPQTDTDDAAARAHAGFLGSVCGCQLGKPVEVNPSLAELKSALSSCDAWPLDDYVPVAALDALGRRAESWVDTARENLRFAAEDDDINYTLLGMLLLEAHGLDFTREHLVEQWCARLPLLATYGPERKSLAAWGLTRSDYDAFPEHPLTELLVLGDLWCGAQIRADAYGYACPHRPRLAAQLAWRDAGTNHTGTGLYATMFTAAALAAAFAPTGDPLDPFRAALRCVPRRSRFADQMTRALTLVDQASSWQAGYDAVHAVFGEHGHCLVVQETATLMNTLKFATSVGHGICLQVMQGNDTDSYGATAGALLGVHFGPGHLDDRWLAPFNDTLHVGFTGFRESRLSVIADRVAQLPRLTLSA